MKIRTELDDIGASLARLKYQLMGVKFELKLRKRVISTKDGFDPEQPRDEIGRWSDVGGGAVGSVDDALFPENNVFAIFADLDSLPFTTRIAKIFEQEDANETEVELQAVGARITYSNAVTGDERIDGTTERLSTTLKNVMNVFEVIPSGMPGVYGTAVHSAFGAAVRAQSLEGVEVEFSYKNNVEVTYGEEGSVRADVVLRSVGGEVIAIYDLKTGGAVVRSSRADELRRHFSASRYVPVIELHILRGSRIKHATLGPHSQYYPEADSRLRPVW
jgi:hypothetical protein